MFKCKYKLAARANERKVCGRATAAQCLLQSAAHCSHAALKLQTH